MDLSEGLGSLRLSTDSRELSEALEASRSGNRRRDSSISVPFPNPTRERRLSQNWRAPRDSASLASSVPNRFRGCERAFASANWRAGAGPPTPSDTTDPTSAASSNTAASLVGAGLLSADPVGSSSKVCDESQPNGSESDNNMTRKKKSKGKGKVQADTTSSAGNPASSTLNPAALTFNPTSSSANTASSVGDLFYEDLQPTKLNFVDAIPVGTTASPDASEKNPGYYEDLQPMRLQPAGTLTLRTKLRQPAQQSRATSSNNRPTPAPGPRPLPRQQTVRAVHDLKGIAPSNRPQPTAAYLQQAATSPTEAPTPQTLLIILDLNGTLCERTRSGDVHHRPGLAPFLKYCLQNHKVMIWSSARGYNVTRVCSLLFSDVQRQKLVARWGRETLGLSAAEFGEKVQVYKRLHVLWAAETVQQSHPQAGEGGTWDQRNTVLIDDSEEKAASEPFNHLAIPEYSTARNRVERKAPALVKVVEYLEQARRYSDVSTFIQIKRFAIEK